MLAMAIATLPAWLSLPVPQHALAITHARFITAEGQTRPVSLPHAQRQHRTQSRYRVAFDLIQTPRQPLYLFIPTLSYRAVVSLDSDRMQDTGINALVPGITLGVSALVPLSGVQLSPGRHEIDIVLDAPGIARGYLSALYVGTAPQVVPYHRMRVLTYEYLRMMVLACQLLLAIATLLVWAYRPQESLYGWLFLLLVVSAATYAGLLADIVPDVFVWLPYAFTVSMASVFILHVIALKISGTEAPAWLRACVVAVPGACLVAMATGAVSARFVVMGVVVPVLVCSPLITVALSAWGVFVRKVQEAWLLLLPLCLFSLATLYDGAIIAGMLDGPVFLSIYYRQLLLVAIAVILMRRLGLSLRSLDSANAHLKSRLAEREAELRRLYEDERLEAARRVRHEERHRLTEDLHDGLSGHLASMIAVAEHEQAAHLEHMAREALDDLRLVIHSMDIGDRELTAALAGLHERLAPRLKRQGVALDWSMARLPEIAGVTPTGALHVLRIVQEAVTNALRHGPASRIAVRGHAGAQGAAHIVIENDGVPYAGTAAGEGGTGVRNMRRRADFLGGSLDVEATEGGTRVVLRLPGHLAGSV